jgi:hypothetical protein
MLPVIFVLLQSAAQPELPRQWAQFSRSGALSHVSETVDIATADRGNSRAFRYTLRLTRARLGAEPTVTWADSASCPAVQPVIAGMRDIRMPTPAPYGVPGGEAMTLTLDGARYTLAAPSSDNMGRLTISSNIGSPLAAWVDAALQQLAPCWTGTAP